MRENLYGRIVKSMKQYIKAYFGPGRILDTGTDEDVSIAGMKHIHNIYMVKIIDKSAKADHALSMKNS